MEKTTTKNEAKQSKFPYWLQLALVFFLGWIFVYASRNIFSASMVAIGKEFSLTGVQLGLINSLFYLAYTVVQIPSGAISDKIGLKVILVFGFVLFGVFTGLTGIAASFAVLIIMRIMVGIGQGTYYGPQYALSSLNIPKKNRAIGNAIINSGMAFGTSLGLIGGGFIVNKLGWRWNFYIFAIPIVLIAILFQFVIKKNKASEQERPADHIEAVEEIQVERKGDRRNIIAIFIIVFCSLFGFFFIQTWLPTYLELERDIAKESVGFISSLVAWSSIPGALLWARLSDRFKNRKPFMVGLLLFALASTLGTGLLKSFPLLIVSLVLYGLTGKLALDPLLVSSLADNAPSKNPGTLFSTFNFIGMSASIVAPYVGGFLQDKTGSLSGTFYLAAGFLMIGLIVALFVYHEKKSPAQISAA
ncbi:MAG: MFS transporter [Chloroflexi bacterium]|jgi:MFS family permease|nr:MFS transporter [Chloroflexota bacterium]